MGTSLDTNSQWQPSLWADTATPAPTCPPLPGDVDTEVAVVGAGYTGLSAALHLAEAGRQVTVLDRFGPGWGCSGRNGGQVNPAWKLLPDDLEAKLGAPAARRGIMMAGQRRGRGPVSVTGPPGRVGRSSGAGAPSLRKSVPMISACRFSLQTNGLRDDRHIA
jgi:hypothetical protein